MQFSLEAMYVKQVTKLKRRLRNKNSVNDILKDNFDASQK